jgi:hypothetical protein
VFGTNFVAFFTVQGFFIGFIFGLLRTDSAYGLFVYTLLVTLFFYLFSHIVISFYFRTLSVRSGRFSKELHEADLEQFIHEINKRESFIDAPFHREKMHQTVKKEPRREETAA